MGEKMKIHVERIMNENRREELDEGAAMDKNAERRVISK